MFSWAMVVCGSGRTDWSVLSVHLTASRPAECSHSVTRPVLLIMASSSGAPAARTFASSSVSCFLIFCILPCSDEFL